MIYGPVRTTRIAYRRRGKENLYPQDAELNWGEHAYSAGIVARNAGAVAAGPFEQAVEQVSAQGAIRLGKRQCEQLAIAAAGDFHAFYASRLPQPCQAGTGLLLTADGSGFPVLPAALRAATAKAAVADIPPAPRTAGDIITALFGPASSSSGSGSGGGPAPEPGPHAHGK